MKDLYISIILVLLVWTTLVILIGILWITKTPIVDAKHECFNKTTKTITNYTDPISKQNISNSIVVNHPGFCNST